MPGDRQGQGGAVGHRAGGGGGGGGGGVGARRERGGGARSELVEGESRLVTVEGVSRGGSAET